MMFPWQLSESRHRGPFKSPRRGLSGGQRRLTARQISGEGAYVAESLLSSRFMLRKDTRLISDWAFFHLNRHFYFSVNYLTQVIFGCESVPNYVLLVSTLNKLQQISIECILIYVT